MTPNTHYYVKDPESGIVYRSVGYTYESDLIVYPKYIPSFIGKRGDSAIKYQGVNYPSGGVKLLASNGVINTSVVKVRFNSAFHTFLPMAQKRDLVLYDPLETMHARFIDETPRSQRMKALVQLLSADSGVGLDNFGLDASMLAGMDKEGSDIDIVVYGKENALKVRNVWEMVEGTSPNGLSKPIDNSTQIVQRRMAYSPLMTEEEILLWEECKISGYFEGVKFSVMPIDTYGRYDREYVPTGQFGAIRVQMNQDEMICDPGILDLRHHKVDVIYGPDDIRIDQFVTFLPSRMGIFLKKGQSLFILGKIHATSLDKKGTSFAITQFPWDDRSHMGESFFVAKREIVNLQNMIPSLLGLNFSNTYFTD